MPSSPKPISRVSAMKCDSTLWNHVYNPHRLQPNPFEGQENCQTVTGTIEVIRHEADGDQHILVKLDPQFSGLTNSVNDSRQKGDLVVEPVCNTTPTQQDTIDQNVCNGFSQNFGVVVGDHVSITGDYVTDTEHGWAEIHPITSMVKQ